MWPHMGLEINLNLSEDGLRVSGRKGYIFTLEFPAHETHSNL